MMIVAIPLMEDDGKYSVCAGEGNFYLQERWNKVTGGGPKRIIRENSSILAENRITYQKWRKKDGKKKKSFY